MGALGLFVEECQTLYVFTVVKDKMVASLYEMKCEHLLWRTKIKIMHRCVRSMCELMLFAVCLVTDLIHLFQFKTSVTEEFKFNKITFLYQSNSLQFFLIGSAAAESSKEAEGITWTSSGSDFSDDGNKILVPRLQRKKIHASKIEDLPSSPEDRSSEGKFKCKQICHVLK